LDNELRAFLMEMREEFRTEIAGIKKDISELKADVAELKADVAKLDKRMEMVEFKQDVGNKKLKELNYSFVILDRRVDRDFSKIEDETDTIIQILRMNKLVSA
jgi:predicted  nucleic acid-binding Zn-ribbon protein